MPLPPRPTTGRSCDPVCPQRRTQVPERVRARAGEVALYLVLARRWPASYRLDGLTVAFVNCALAAAVLGRLVLVTDSALLAPADPPVEAVVT